MGNTCKPMADSFWCMTKFTTNKKKKKKEKKRSFIPIIVTKWWIIFYLLWSIFQVVSHLLYYIIYHLLCFAPSLLHIIPSFYLLWHRLLCFNNLLDLLIIFLDILSHLLHIFVGHHTSITGFPSGSDGKESACNAEIQVQSLGQEDPLEEGMATHSSILAWRIP